MSAKQGILKQAYMCKKTNMVAKYKIFIAVTYYFTGISTVYIILLHAHVIFHLYTCLY